MQVNMKVVSALIDLKIGAHKLSPKECRDRIRFTREEDLLSRGLSWDEAGIAEEIARHVDYNTFMHLTDMDGDCERLLRKARLDAVDFFVVLVLTVILSIGTPSCRS